MPEPKINLPGSVTLHLTEMCNLRCKMCYAWGETGFYSKAASPKKPAVMDIEVLKRLVKDLSPRMPQYSLFGGEPLTYPHLEELIVAVKEADSFIDTPTNGTLLEKNAPMLVRAGIDSIRVSIDGDREASDAQRGAGSYDKAMAGIEALFRERAKPGSRGPVISIIYTVTPENYLAVEKFFLKEIDLKYLNWATIQLQNFVTEKMGQAYARMLEDEYGIKSDTYWRGMLRDPKDFDGLDYTEMARQIRKVVDVMGDMGKPVSCLPPTINADSYRAYFAAKWGEMADKYRTCHAPWTVIDVTASGDVAPCHIFYDMTFGNLHKQSIKEIWYGENFRKMRAYMEKHGLMSICYGCCVLYINGEKVIRNYR